MSKLITFLLSFILVAAHAAPVFKQGKDVVRLTGEPCPVKVKEHIPAPFDEQARKAFVILNGKDHSACYVLVPSGHIIVVLSNGKAAAIPLDDFVDDPGI